MGTDTSQPPNFGGVFCSSNPAESCSFANLGLASGQLRAPFDGVIVRWRIWGDSTDKQFKLQVIRDLGGGAFTAAGASEPRTVEPGAERAFPTSTPVSQGDQLAIHVPGGTTGNEPSLPRRVNLGLPSNTNGIWIPALSIGESPGRPSTTDPNPDQSYLYNADVEPDCDRDGLGDESQDPDLASCQPPSNEFTFGKAKKNKKKGTAKLTVNLPGPGDVELAGEKLKPASAQAQGAGDVRLTVKAKGKAKKKLRQKGKAKVAPEVTYTPTGGAPNTESTKLRLVKK